MIKALKFVGLALLAAASTATASASTTSLTNVLQNVSLQLTIYQQTSTNNQGTKIVSKPVSYTTKNLISALQTVTGRTFEPGAKLVLSTVFSNVTVTNLSSNNLAVVPPTSNFYVYIGSTGPTFENFFTNTGTVVLSNGTFVSGFSGSITITNNLVINATNANESVTFITNAGYETTFIPSTNISGLLTNIAVVSQKPGTSAITETIFTNVSSTVDVLYGSANTLYPVTNYLIFSTNSPQVITAAGSGLNANTPIFSSQTGVSISNLVINYFAPAGTTNLGLTLEGFVKQALKVDVLSRHGTNIVVADIFGANSTWNVIGSGYYGGTFSSNAPGIPVSNYVNGAIVSGYLTNSGAVVVQGTVNISFLKNLVQ